MSNIRILPEILANQIAAGEVIERPASVVKELVENSLDAGASQIQVHFEGDGTRLIRIIDDGSGMDEDDVLLSLERHATSKIKSAEELQGIKTLGFRGEALPSIASVAKLIITSRVRTAALGTRAEINFGRILKVHDCGCSAGTTIEVRDLFGNMPARKKFVRAARTELFHVEEIIKNYALAYQAVGFSLAVDGSPVLELPAGDSSPAGRARRFYCRSSREQLIEVNSRGDAAGGKNVQVSGFLVPPDPAAAGSSRLRFFVNGRAVRDRLMSQAVNEGLQGFIMKGSKPSGVFFVKVLPEMVDVNVHPTKQEVRFRRHADVQSVLATAVRQAMGSYQGLLKYQLFGESQGKGDPGRARREFPTASGSGPLFPAGIETHEPVSPYEERAQTDLPWAASGKTSQAVFESIESPGVYLKVHGVTGSVSPSKPPVLTQSSCTDTAAGRRRADEKNVRPEGRSLKFIGQLLETYILCENEEGLLAIDQHAAHERLLFEALRKQFDDKSIPSQNLLFPAVVEYAPETLRLLAEHHDHLARLGLSLQEFGGTSCIIKAVPAILAHLSPAEIVGEIVGHLEKAGSAKDLSLALLNSILSSMACKAAIKAGRRLAPLEAETLLRQLAGADIFSHCPHGRPVTKQFSSSEIRRWFHRG